MSSTTIPTTSSAPPTAPHHLLFTTRNLLDLNVNKTHTISILIHLRPRDIKWWNDERFLERRKILVKLIYRRILPIECKEDMEAYFDKLHGRKRRAVGGGGNDNVDRNTGLKGRNVEDGDIRKVVGSLGSNNDGGAGQYNPYRKKKRRVDPPSRNVDDDFVVKKKRSKDEKTTTQQLLPFAKNRKSTNTTLTTKSKRNTGTAQSKKGASTSTRSKTDTTNNNGNNTEQNRKQTYLETLDIKYLFSDDDFQITYKVEPISIAHSTTLLYKRNINSDQSNYDDTATTTSSSKRNRRTKKREKQAVQPLKLSSFQKLRKIPKRIVLWCFPFDPTDPHKDMELSTEMDGAEGGGFPRPEMIPISSLFKER